MFCSKCGNRLEEGAAFCSKCGTQTGNINVAVMEKKEHQGIRSERT